MKRTDFLHKKSLTLVFAVILILSRPAFPQAAYRAPLDSMGSLMKASGPKATDFLLEKNNYFFNHDIPKNIITVNRCQKRNSNWQDSWELFCLNNGIQHIKITDQINPYEEIIRPEIRLFIENVKIGDDCELADQMLAIAIAERLGGAVINPSFSAPRGFKAEKSFASVFLLRGFVISAGENIYQIKPGRSGLTVSNDFFLCSADNPITKQIVENIPENYLSVKQENIVEVHSYLIGDIFLTSHMTVPFTLLPVTFLQSLKNP